MHHCPASVALRFFLGISVVTACFNVNAKDIQSLEADESYIVVGLKYRGKDWLGLRFGEFDGKDKFVIRSNGDTDPHLVRVKAGSYYFQRIESPFRNRANANRDRPESRDLAIAVPAGAVVYIGDWILTQNPRVLTRHDMEMRFDNESLLFLAKEHPELTELPLKVSMIGRPIIDVTWQ